LTAVWKNSFLAGAPKAAELVVTGSAAGVVPATTAETFVAAAVPPGTYSIAVRTRNASGASTTSTAVPVTVPGTCVAPQVPLRAVVYAVGAGRHGAVWDPNPAGGAPDRYEIVASNAVNATVSVGLQRVHDVAVAPGTYDIRVRAVNACGASPLTAVQTVVVP
jgi:predicted phage tail protein